MKSPQELLELFDPYMNKLVGENFSGHISMSELQEVLSTIQQDAFESGRVEGRKFELTRVAQILRDSGEPKLVAMANSCELLSGLISPPPYTKSDVEVQK